MDIVHIVCFDKNRCIGGNNTLLWNVPEDSQHFKETTKGHVIVLGRKTADSLPKKLPYRITIAVGNTHSVNADITTSDLSSALSLARYRSKRLEHNQFFIAGGSSIYKQTLNQATKLIITELDTEVNGDSYYPDYSDFKLDYSTDWFESKSGIKYRIMYYSK